MKFDSMFESKYMKATDLVDESGDPIDITVTIAKITKEEMNDGEVKPVIYFKEMKQGAVLNITNGKRLQGFFGNDTDDWLGKKVVIFQTETEYGGKTTMGWRIRGKLPGYEKAAGVGHAAPRTAVTHDDPRTTRVRTDEDHPYAPKSKLAKQLDDDLPEEFQ